MVRCVEGVDAGHSDASTVHADQAAPSQGRECGIHGLARQSRAVGQVPLTQVKRKHDAPPVGDAVVSDELGQEAGDPLRSAANREARHEALQPRDATRLQIGQSAAHGPMFARELLQRGGRNRYDRRAFVHLGGFGWSARACGDIPQQVSTSQEA